MLKSELQDEQENERHNEAEEQSTEEENNAAAISVKSAADQRKTKRKAEIEEPADSVEKRSCSKNN